MMIENNYLLFGLLFVALVITFSLLPNGVMAQQQQPQLEKEPITKNNNETKPQFSFLGKVTIPITTSQQIIIDLPISKDSKIQIVPIK